MISSIKIFRQTEEPEKNINNYLSPFFYDAFLLFTIYKLLISYGNICQRALSQRKAKAKHTKHIQTLYTDINVKRRILLL